MWAIYIQMRDRLVTKRMFVEKEAPISVAEKTQPAPFVDDRDWIVLELCTSLYTDPIHEKDGWVISPEGTTSVRMWTKDDTVIVGIMGTSSKAGLSNILDDAALAGIVEDSCDLSVVNQASALIDQIDPDKNIIVGGHSLGGAAAFCLAHKYPQVRAVSFNGGAPPTGGGVKGAGRERCRFYHIVGDIISTHIDDSTAEVSRIHLLGVVEWNNTKYYHSTERFFEHRSFDTWTAQEEQNSMANFVYNLSPSTFFLTLLTGLISKEFNKDRIREIICKNPIPGTDPNCPDIINSGRVIATLAGGLIGGFLGGPAGLLAGGKAGYEIGSGKGILDFIAPQVLPTVRGVAKKALTVGQKINRRKKYVW
jgi:hypothetical protein